MTKTVQHFCSDPACGHQAVVHDEKGKCNWAGCKCRGLLAGITKREMDILKGLAGGLGIKGTATKLGLSVSTVEAHKYNMMRKTGAQSILELVLGGLKSGIITMEHVPEFTSRVYAR